MKVVKNVYKVKLTVEFTQEEAEYLVQQAKQHYDGTCRAAGLMIGEDGATQNGFIAQLAHFGLEVTWEFDKFDLASKVLEMRHTGTRGPVIGDELAWSFMQALILINKEQERLSVT